MTALAESRQDQRSLLGSLLIDLAPHEGRGLAVARIVVGCAITVTIAMLFQIPQPAYMAYIVFLISKDEQSATLTASIGGLIAGTLATVLALGLSLVDSGEPAMRLPLMALATFVAMFVARTSPLGPISYLAGFMLVLLQSLTDDIPNPERLTRLTLWIWVIVAVPVAVTVIVNMLFGKGAAIQAARTVRRILSQLATTLASGSFPHWLPGWRAQLAPLLSLRTAGRIPVPAIAALLEALVILETLPDDLCDATRAALADRVNDCLNAIERNPTVVERTESIQRVASSAPGAHAFIDALSELLAALNGTHKTTTAAPPPARRLLAADAFRNPIYWQFALKSTLAVMVSYIIYTLLDWGALRTAIVTCFLVALSSLGETVHKLLLRLSGAIIGGLFGALSIVFVLPHLTDIGQLLLLIGSVSAGAAWIATGSERFSYAGMQIAFAFFLGVLQGYAPATDLTVLRDRVVGILLGNVVITIVFGSLWPESARLNLRSAIAEALRAMAQVLARVSETESKAARIKVAQELVLIDRLRILSLLEMGVLPGHSASIRSLPNAGPLERMAGAALTSTSASMSPYIEPASLAPMVRWAITAADELIENQPPPRPPPPSSHHTGVTPPASPHALAARALDQLASEAQYVADATR